MFEPLTIRLGRSSGDPHLLLDVLDYEHPDVVEPAGLDRMKCRATAYAPPVSATFDVELRLDELFDLQHYLLQINSGVGPSENFTFAGGLLTLSFAPSRRGPVLCAVMLKAIDASHVRLEYMITLEPESISQTIAQFGALERQR